MKVQSNILLAHNNHFADDAKRNNTLIYYIALLNNAHSIIKIHYGE